MRTLITLVAVREYLTSPETARLRRRNRRTRRVYDPPEQISPADVTHVLVAALQSTASPDGAPQTS